MAVHKPVVHATVTQNVETAAAAAAIDRRTRTCAAWHNPHLVSPLFSIRHKCQHMFPLNHSPLEGFGLRRRLLHNCIEDTGLIQMPEIEGNLQPAHLTSRNKRQPEKLRVRVW